MTVDWDPHWTPHYLAEVWWCGDEYCDCNQPRITLKTPNLLVRPGWYRLTQIWEGNFISEPTLEEMNGLRKQLKEECIKRGIPVGLSPAVHHPPDIALRVERLAEIELANDSLFVGDHDEAWKRQHLPYAYRENISLELDGWSS